MAYIVPYWEYIRNAHILILTELFYLFIVLHLFIKISIHSLHYFFLFPTYLRDSLSALSFYYSHEYKFLLSSSTYVPIVLECTVDLLRFQANVSQMNDEGYELSHPFRCQLYLLPAQRLLEQFLLRYAYLFFILKIAMFGVYISSDTLSMSSLPHPKALYTDLFYLSLLLCELTSSQRQYPQVSTSPLTYS